MRDYRPPSLGWNCGDDPSAGGEYGILREKDRDSRGGRKAGCDPRVCQGIFPGQHGAFYPEDRKEEHDCDPGPQYLWNGKPLAGKAPGNSCNRRLYLCVREYRRTGCPCAARKDPAGRIWRQGKGRVPGRTKEIAKDFNDSGISENSLKISAGCLENSSYVSPIGAAGLYYHATAADFQREGEEREAFKAMIREIMALAEVMGVPFERDYVKVNLEILSHLAPESTTSMQRDVMEGKQSEIDGLVYEVVRMGEKYHVPMPVYKKIADVLKER